MRNRTWPVLFLLLIGRGCSLWAQVSESPEDRLSRLRDNVEGLSMVVSLDRNTAYIPGEWATITIAITNTTSAAVEIPDPHDPRTAGFDLFVKGGQPESMYGPEWGGHDSPIEGPALDVPSVFLQPAQTITLTAHSNDMTGPNTLTPWFTEMTTIEGTYRLRYRLGRHVDFQVVTPYLEAAFNVPLHHFDHYTSDSTAQPVTDQLAAVVIAVTLNGQHLICVSKQEALLRGVMEKDSAGKLAQHSSQNGAPWLRLISVPTAITSLSATANQLDLITIEYAGTDGIHHLLYLDANRKLIGQPPPHPQIVAAPTFSPTAGSYTSPRPVSISTPTSGASIHYTIDGTQPSSAVGTLFTGPISIAVTRTIKAIAFAPAMTDSPVSSITCNINLQAVAPTFNPPGGTYTAAQAVAISKVTSGASIRHTTDGSQPSVSVGAVYKGSVTIGSSATMKAIAYGAGIVGKPCLCRIL